MLRKVKRMVEQQQTRGIKILTGLGAYHSSSTCVLRSRHCPIAHAASSPNFRDEKLRA